MLLEASAILQLASQQLLLNLAVIKYTQNVIFIRFFYYFSFDNKKNKKLLMHYLWAR
jgi:hypothetical protein